MDSLLQVDNEGARLSNSPRRSPQVTEGFSSPVRSVYPSQGQMQQMDSINSQPDFGLRTADFFDDGSSEGSAHLVDSAPDVDLLERQGSATKRRHPALSQEPLVSQCESKHGTFDPNSQGYQRLAPSAGFEDNIPIPDTASSNFNGSVAELLPGATHSSPPPFARASRIPSGRTPRSSAHIDRADDRQGSETPVKIDQTLGAYAIAHEITLNALMRDEDALDRSLQSFALAPMPAGARASMLPTNLDPRSPRNRTFSSPPNSNPKRKVSLVPPPIDTSAPRRSLPDDLVRTPYPFSPETEVRRKDFGHVPPSATVSTLASISESVLSVSIRRSNQNSRLRVTTLTIPASNDFSALRSSDQGSKQRHFKAIDFDDEAFFQELRLSYRRLSGPLRFLSARSPVKVTVCGAASKAADANYGWLPRSPRALASKGLTDTFSKEKILQHYRKPALGRSRYAFVHWAHRLAAAPPLRTPQGEDAAETTDRDLARRKEQPEGLEFVVRWSVKRIVLVLCLILLISIAAALLWVLLGHNTAPETPDWPSKGGFRDAGDRVTAGVVTGICVLLLGLSSMAGWLGVSWLLM